MRNSFNEDERNNFVVPSFKRAMLYPDDIAVKDVAGEFTYFQLYITAKKLAIQISNFCGSIYICNQLQFHYKDMYSNVYILF